MTVDRPKWKGVDWVPAEMVDLQDELSKHPDMLQKLRAEGHETFSEAIGSVAAELGIVLDGAYSEEDIKGLCRTLTQKLRARRSPIITHYTGKL